MAIASFAPTAALAMIVTSTSSNVTLPTVGTPTVALVTNLSDQVVFVLLGDSTVKAAMDTAMAILPRTQAAFTIGTNTTLAAVSIFGPAGLNVAVGN